mmetsp:Transcript_35651/g.57685  ORF Transcript_35651/g.57685 Transcript_35651/m.57685 type:complete len:322 (+) Transcript_35651:1250-2215(+)
MSEKQEATTALEEVQREAHELEKAVNAAEGGRREAATKRLALTSEVEVLRREVEQAAAQHAKDGAEWQGERSRMEGRMRGLEEVVAAAKEQATRAGEAVMIKQAMLDDHLDTIRKLKEKLSDKDKELERVRKEQKEAPPQRPSDEFLEEQLEATSRTNASLKHQVGVQEEIMSHMEGLLEEAKGRNEQLQAELAAMRSAAKDKEDMIKFVETEISQVKQMFSDREKKLIEERDREAKELRVALEASQAAVREAERRAEASQALASERMAACEQTSRELLGTRERLASVEDEIRTLLRSVEKQKREAAAHIQRLTSVFAPPP